MAVKKILPLQASTRPETKNFLTSSVISIGDPLAINSGGQVVPADCNAKETSHVVGFATKAHTGGTVVTTPVQVGGNLAAVGWTFTEIGQPVFLDIAGGLTQDTSAFPETAYITEVGIAIGANQIMVKPKAPVLLKVINDENLAVASKVIFSSLDKAAKRDKTKTNQTGVLVQFKADGETLETLDGVSAPAEDGVLLTNNSMLECVNYGG